MRKAENSARASLVEFNLLVNKVTELENKQTLFIDHWTIASSDVLGNKRNNNGIIEEYNGSAWVVVAIVDGDIWFDSDDDTLSVYNNNVWTLIPLSTDSVYVDRTTNQQYAWSGTTMTSMTVPLTKASIESLIYSPKLLLTGTTINLAVAEVFDRFATPLTGSTTFTITNPILYKGFRIKLKGGSIPAQPFTGYTATWVLNSLNTDYDATNGSWLNCEVRDDSTITLFWGE